MTNQNHLTNDEVELWAQGLLGASRALHLSDCAACHATADRERKLIVELAQLPQFAPSSEFAGQVMHQVRVPTPSGSQHA